MASFFLDLTGIPSSSSSSSSQSQSARELRAIDHRVNQTSTDALTCSLNRTEDSFPLRRRSASKGSTSSRDNLQASSSEEKMLPPLRKRSASKEAKEMPSHVRERSGSVTLLGRNPFDSFFAESSSSKEPKESKELKESKEGHRKRSESTTRMCVASSSSQSTPQRRREFEGDAAPSEYSLAVERKGSKKVRKREDDGMERRHTDLTSRKEEKALKTSSALKELPENMITALKKRLQQVVVRKSKIDETKVEELALVYLKTKKKSDIPSRCARKRGEQLEAEFNLSTSLGDDCVLRGKVIAKAAEWCLKNGGKVIPIQEGSGGVYIITDSSGKKLFVFKPQNEAPGQPKNPKGFSQIDPNDPESNFYGFEPEKGIYRDYAISLFWPGIIKTICELSLVSEEPPECGLLMEYIEHICNLEKLRDSTNELLQKKADENQFLIALSKYPSTFAGLLKASVASINKPVSLSQLDIWKHITKASVWQSMAQDIQCPGVDSNAGNFILVERLNSHGEIIYEILRIDNEFVYSREWTKVSPPAWYGTALGDTVIADIPILSRIIMGLDALKDFEFLYSHGIKLGGKAIAITTAWHCAAQMALQTKATVNQLGFVLYEPGAKGLNRLYDLYVEAQNLKLTSKENFWGIFKGTVKTALLHKMKLDFKKLKEGKI